MGSLTCPIKPQKGDLGISTVCTQQLLLRNTQGQQDGAGAVGGRREGGEQLGFANFFLKWGDQPEIIPM